MPKPEASQTSPTYAADLIDGVPGERVIHSSERAFAGAVWDIRRDSFEYGGETLVRDYMDHTGAVAVLALDESDRVLLIQQYRHPIAVRDWEIPAGLMDVVGESPLLGAKRELAEEADLAATDWSLLTEFYTSPGGSSESIRVYLARGLSATETFARTGEEADIERAWVPLDDVVTAVLERRVQNSVMCIAVLAAHASRERNWSTLGNVDEPWERREWVRGERS
ncbi:NUDIX domain-containing protein [Lysinibacter cavernae]|uniref:ADP-ribose pyrophosphatase n=1 Tax=Lysinibacter cavernae TaxID=1640652 RepID=A0A7X5R0D3_9MICO|nr:NUDIX hydrolase [Lysinibacter cavernae]NIH53354.1 ADP-ribose pyrophosphatase [Lysinibacter cavernae]